MIKSIKFLDHWDNMIFIKNQVIPLSNVTILVGDQGAGKTTLLNIIKNAKENVKYKNITLEGDAENIIKLDFDKDTGDKFLPNYNNSEQLLASIVGKSMYSHGENTINLINSLSDIENNIILLDEPDLGLSLRSTIKLINFIDKLAEKNQIIISTHNIPIINKYDDFIYSVEHKMKMSAEEYFESHKSPSDFKEKRQDLKIKLQNCIKGNACTCSAKTGWFNNKCDFYIKRGLNKTELKQLYKKHNLEFPAI